MLTSGIKLLLYATVHATLHTPLLTTNNFTQQIITSMKFSFEFLYSFGPTHARKIVCNVNKKTFYKQCVCYYCQRLLLF